MLKPTEETINEHFRLKEEKREEKKNGSGRNKEKYNSSRKDYNAEYSKDFRENFREENNKYMRAWMKYSREKKKNPEMNITFKEWKEKNIIYLNNLEIKTIENPVKRLSSYFPKEELNKNLDDILSEKIPIKEKTLQDIIYDIMERKGILTIERLIAIYNSPTWANAIGEVMQERNYSKNGDDNYVHT